MGPAQEVIRPPVLRAAQRQARCRGVRRRVAMGMSSNNGGRIAGTPRTDSAARGSWRRDPGDPSDRRNAGSEPSHPHRSCQRFYSSWHAAVIRCAQHSRNRPRRRQVVADGAAEGTAADRTVGRNIFRSRDVDAPRLPALMTSSSSWGQMPTPSAPVSRQIAGVRIVDNPDYEQGQLTSLLAGLRADRRDARHSGSRHAHRCAARQRRHGAHADDAAQRDRGAPIVRPVSNGRHGHPVIFGRALFAELERADPAHSARSPSFARTRRK